MKPLVKKQRLITGVIRNAARLYAEELIAQLFTPAEVQRKLATRYRVSPCVADGICKEALAELRRADDGDRENRMARMVAQIGKLYRDAHKEKRYAVCRQLLADVRRMQGIEGALKLDVREEANSLSTRSDEELEYFKEHGYWPEEAPRAAGKAPAKASDNPLERLVH